MKDVQLDQKVLDAIPDDNHPDIDLLDAFDVPENDTDVH